VSAPFVFSSAACRADRTLGFPSSTRRLPDPRQAAWLQWIEEAAHRRRDPIGRLAPIAREKQNRQDAGAQVRDLASWRLFPALPV